jgi:hypothetical protein
MLKQRVTDRRALFVWRVVFSAMATWNFLWLLFESGELVRDLVGTLIGVAGIVVTELTYGRRVRAERAPE